MTALWFLPLLLLAVLRPTSADGWQPVANTMTDPRWAPAYTLLAGGARGLIVGGYSFPADRCVATADEFDPRTRCFVPCAGRLAVPRNFAQASLLPSGHVLITGGYNTVLGSLDSAELYDPARRVFELLPARLAVPRELFTATPLADGRVLMVGGFNTHRGRTQASAEIYDPATRAFTLTGSLTTDRFGQDAVRLADGRVLVVGGTHWFVRHPALKLASGEIYDPLTGRFHATRGPLHFPRDRPTATLLPDGTVLVAGGQNDAGEPEQAEVFDPKTETFSLLPGKMTAPRMAHTAAALPGGRVLLAGGWSVPMAATTGSVELYDPLSQRFTALPPLPAGAHDQALLVFPNGLVLIAGGKEAGGGKKPRSVRATSGSCLARKTSISKPLISRKTGNPVTLAVSDPAPCSEDRGVPKSTHNCIVRQNC